MVRTNAWKSATRITTAFIIDSDPDTYNFRLTYTNPSFKYVGSKCFSGPLEFNHERCYTTNTQGGSCVGSATTIRSRSFRKYHQPLMPITPEPSPPFHQISLPWWFDPAR